MATLDQLSRALAVCRSATLISSTDPRELLNLCQEAYPRHPDDVPSLALLWWVISSARADLLSALAARTTYPGRHVDRLGEVIDFLNGPRLTTFCRVLRLAEAREVRQEIARDAGLEVHGPRALICLPEDMVEML